MDLSKAFDSIGHDVLLFQLCNYVNYALIENYLFNRKQYVDFISSKSSMENVTIGVPQGLVLGNLIMNNELSI